MRVCQMPVFDILKITWKIAWEIFSSPLNPQRRIFWKNWIPVRSWAQ